MHQPNSQCSCSYSDVKVHFVSCVKAMFIILGEELTQGGGCLHPGELPFSVHTCSLWLSRQALDWVFIQNN